MAIALEFGKCVQCNDNNSKQTQSCRQCGAPLPWAKASKPKIVKTSAARAGSAAAKPSFQMNWGLWAVGVFSFMMPLVGFFLYRSYSENGDEKADAALIGSILAIIAIVAKLALRILAPAS